MKITSSTKISELIKANPKTIDTIASINKHFEKLRNPILRKILASRVTISDAAKIGGCTVEDFVKKLQEIGFDIANDSNKTISMNNQNFKSKPSFMDDVNPENTTVLDVRNGLASGNDPFQKIMGTLAEMPEQNTLLIINTFEPIPLINILKKKGYEYYTESHEGIVNTYLKKTGIIPLSPSTTENSSANVNFDEKKHSFGERIVTVDVRELEMPLPMVTILQELEKLPKDAALFVHHKKVPQYLLPELRERNFICLIKEMEEGNVKLLIYKSCC